MLVHVILRVVLAAGAVLMAAGALVVQQPTGAWCQALAGVILLGAGTGIVIERHHAQQRRPSLRS